MIHTRLVLPRHPRHGRAAYPLDDYEDAWMDFDEDMGGFLVAQDGAFGPRSLGIDVGIGRRF